MGEDLVFRRYRAGNPGRFTHCDRIAGDPVAAMGDEAAADATPCEHEPIDVLRDE